MPFGHRAEGRLVPLFMKAADPRHLARSRRTPRRADANARQLPTPPRRRRP